MTIKTKFPYDFPTVEIKRNFKVEAAKKNTSIVCMITDALKLKYPYLFKIK